MSRRNKKPEMKWVSYVNTDTSIAPQENWLGPMTPVNIPLGPGRHQAIGAKVKFMRVTYSINVVATTGTQNWSLFRLALVTPRTNIAGFTDQVDEAMNNRFAWDHQVVQIHMDDQKYLFRNDLGIAPASWHVKGSIRFPRNVQLNSDGDLMDDKDRIYLVCRGYQANLSFTIQIMTKVSYIDA